MVFGSCLIVQNGSMNRLTPRSASIRGSLHGTVAQFVVRQEFQNDGKEAADVNYITPNNLNICMYDTTFYVGDEVIKPQLEEVQQAKQTFQQATDDSRTAILGRSIGNGLAEFKLGNIPPETVVVVEVKCCVFIHICAEDSVQFKIPLDVCTQSGSVGCLMTELRGSLSFDFDCSSLKDEIHETNTNVSGAVYDPTSGKIAFSTSSKDVSSIIVTLKLSHPLESECVAAGKYMAVSLTGSELEKSMPKTKNDEFIFVIDCSGSMSGSRIISARECLQAFLSSLPVGSYFNVIRFGSSLHSLFPTAVPYNEETYGKAKKLASNMQADLGGTNIYEPLAQIFSSPLLGSGQRQVFLLTDGEVWNVDQCVALVKENSDENRVFTLGIGAGADSGIINGLADASGGGSAYVMDANIADRVIPQLTASIEGGAVFKVCMHVEGHDQIEYSQTPNLQLHGQRNFIVKSDKEFHGDEAILFNGPEGANVDFCVTATNPGPEQCDEVSKAFQALFSHKWIQRLTDLMKSQRNDDRKKELRSNIVELSRSSGVLSQFTAFVGFSERKVGAITVKTLTGQKINPLCCGTDVAALKKSVSQETGIPVDQLRLICAGEQLEDDDPLPADDSTVYCVLRLRGGGGPPPDSTDEGQLTLRRILSLQHTDGHWQDVRPLLEVAGKKNVSMLDEIKKLGIDAAVKTDAYYTCVALALLQHYFAQRHEAWALVERKATAWLLSISTTAKWKDFISKIASQL